MAYLLNSLAVLAGKRRDLAQAKSLFHQALAISHQHLGLQHPLVAESLQGLAELSYNQGKTRLARQFYRRALGIREQQLGLQHPDTYATVQSYIALLRETQREEELAALEARFSLKGTAPDNSG